MRFDPRNIVTLPLIILYITTAVVIDFGHGHAVPGNHAPEFHSHDCGATERHPPIGAEQRCGLCQRVLQFASALFGCPATITPDDRPFVPVVASIHFTQEPSFHPDERGPPALV